MGIGEKRFQEMFHSVTSQNESAEQIVNDYYINLKLGFALRKPHDWYFDESNELYRSRNDMRFKIDINDPEAIMAFAEKPLIVATKNDPKSAVSKNDFCPGITVYATYYDENNEGCYTNGYLKEIQGYSHLLYHYELITMPAEITISECQAFCIMARFQFRHAELKESVPVRMYALSIFQNPVVFDIKLYDSPYLGSSYQFDYSDFVTTIVVS